MRQVAWVVTLYNDDNDDAAPIYAQHFEGPQAAKQFFDMLSEGDFDGICELGKLTVTPGIDGAEDDEDYEEINSYEMTMEDDDDDPDGGDDVEEENESEDERMLEKIRERIVANKRTREAAREEAPRTSKILLFRKRA